ncbi:helix-turn-helix domain-containing protein [Nibribacter ruber]|uniref:Helix-turn-helix domain-containing protein n=1 Tax=Nibribacter ruber TaxID=2698458 RepID=A0A6P1P004_9BACT|nr:XRE family transcriptional regulator [Nibribacter ruber]QHL86222.1 helix-turn-helix domain-containing protein [Nibribacter ruber]
MLSTNLKYLRKKENLTQVQLAEKLQIKRSLIGAYEEGRAEPKLVTLMKMAQVFNLSVDELINPELPNLSKSTSSAHNSNVRVLSITVDGQDRENIELVPYKASAGYLNGYADPEFMEELPKFRLPMIQGPGTYRAFEIKGDSMLPIPSGTVIVGRYVERWQDIKDGTPCIVVSMQEGIVFKRIYQKAQDNALRLHSDNPVYQPYEVPLADVVELWEAKAYISTSFPMAEISLDRLTSLVLDLQQEVQKLKTVN